MTKGNDAVQEPITDLPNEMLTHIFQYLDPVDIRTMSHVSRKMNAASKDPMVWKETILLQLAKKEVSPLTYSWIAKLLMSGQITPQLFVEPTIVKAVELYYKIWYILSKKVNNVNESI